MKTEYNFKLGDKVYLENSHLIINTKSITHENNFMTLPLNQFVNCVFTYIYRYKPANCYIANELGGSKKYFKIIKFAILHNTPFTVKYVSEKIRVDNSFIPRLIISNNNIMYPIWGDGVRKI